MKKESIASFVAEQQALLARDAEDKANRDLVEKLSVEGASRNFDVVLSLLKSLAEKEPFNYDVRFRGDICNIRSKVDRRAMQVYLQSAKLTAAYEGGRSTFTKDFQGVAELPTPSSEAVFHWVSSVDQSHFTNDELVQTILVNLAKMHSH